jgi:predicted nucleotidyltransferase component of viral defense system
MVTLTQKQARELNKKLKIRGSVVLREYIQLLFLKELYYQKYSKYIFFKGGIAIRLIFGGERFSEDLDFTITISVDEFDGFLQPFFKRLLKLYDWNFKKRTTLAGETYCLSVKGVNEGYRLSIKLDFSFREDVLKPSKSIIETIYPIVFTSLSIT